MTDSLPQADAGGCPDQAPVPVGRVALIVNDPLQPGWVARLTRHMLDVPGLDVRLVADPSDATAPVDERPGGGRWSKLLYSVFDRYDRRRFGANAGDDMDLRRIVRSDPSSPDDSGSSDFAIGLLLGHGSPDEELRARCVYGVITIRMDGGAGSRPAVREVLAGATVLQYSLLLWRRGVAQPSVILACTLRTNRVSVAATAAHFHAHLAHTLATRLIALARGVGCLAAARTVTEPLPEPKGIVRMAGTLTRLAALRIGRGLRARLQQEDWALAAVRTEASRTPLHFDPHDRLQRPSLLLPPAGTIWADPFPVRRDDRTYVFFEEMERSTGRGHISVIELTAGLEARRIGRALSAPYHLSYPFVFPWNGSLFMLPETEENRTLELYRCVGWPDEWTLEAVLLDGVSAADATIVEANGKWWLFTTMNPPRDADWDTNLYLFHADNPLGPWTPNACNPVKTDVRNSRSAGRLFWHDGRLYRPAQDCAERYGHALVINEITRLDERGFDEREVRRMHGWRSDIVGVHTINQEGDVLLLDCRVRRRKRRG